MNEDVIHFIWKLKPALFNGLECHPGGKVEVISPGNHNFDSGPDFFNAKVKIDNTLWAGNVEIHVKSSDWNRHGHNTDEAYNNVILHVVAHNDMPVTNAKGERVSTIEVPYPHEIEWELQRLVATESWIPCGKEITKINPASIRMWIASLCIQRLEEKTEQVNNLVDEYKGSWEEAFYVSVARSFGLKVNSLPFELLAKSTPLKKLSKVKDSLLSIEALLFGQAGLLDFTDAEMDEYMQALTKEYNYQRVKFQLSPIPKHLWKFMRIRPSAFPTIRLAQFAQLIHGSTGLFSKCMKANKLSDFMEIFGLECSHYWKTHYTFGKTSTSKSKALGLNTVQSIVLNTVIPFMFAYGMARGQETLKDKSINLLEELKPESNSVIRGFRSIGVKADNAFFSQALVQLKNQYCDKRKCLFCQIGTSILLKRMDNI